MKIVALKDLPSRIDEVKALGRANTKTLGFLPEGAFDYYASQNTILIAINENNQCVGYVLWRVSRGQAIIAHLCIQADWRRKGAARKLVEELDHQTQILRGIGLWCRRDYDAHRIWPKLGFVPLGEKPGRSHDGSELTFWWHDHNHPTIFTEAETVRLAARVKVVLDANVFFDLGSNRKHNESHALQADWLLDTVELCLTDEIYNEIDRNQDTQERHRLRSEATKFTILPHDQAAYRAALDTLLPLFERQTSSSSQSDHRQLAKAIASGAHFFTTRDKLDFVHYSSVTRRVS